MAQTTEGVSESVEAVRFSFMTDEEVKRHSVVKITSPNLLDSVGSPVTGGLYDPAMGPLDEQALCNSCGQRSLNCPGHCGHIDLAEPVYNPLLFNMLHNLLQQTCFFCNHFRVGELEVEKCASQLELIAMGDIIGAKRLESIYPKKKRLKSTSQIESDSEDSDGSHISFSTVHFGAKNISSKHLKQDWTSLQLTEAMSVLDRFLKLKSVVCKNEKCKAKNPKISKPTFGWFHLRMSGDHIRQNVIRGHKLERQDTGQSEEKSSSEVVNADNSPLEDSIDTAEINSFKDSMTKRHGRKEGLVPMEFVKQKNFSSRPLLPTEVKDIMKDLWEKEARLCSFICDLQWERIDTSGKFSGHAMFFLDTILVPPIKFRPASKGVVSVMEHPHTVLLGNVIQSNIALGNAFDNKLKSKIVSRWMDLQHSVNVLFDSKTGMGQGTRDVTSGICQLLEKKEGIFRQKMMGKRVNYACRSVISPDPYLAVNEIGIPPYFALRLTYPERVTPWNVNKLRDAIINGSETHPGATHYVDKLSTVKLPPNRKMRMSISRKLPSSRGVVTQSGKTSDYEFEGKIVYRHLQDGDVVLVNRQPTLHKPSIMAHVVRVLKGEKTLRMHYANCSTYNADFDGDEMNVHFPQDEISRAEAYNIVNANNQYIVPTRGDTVRGLIQDHIVSAVLLTMKDTFLTCDEYNQLLYSSGVFSAGPGSFSGNRCQKIFVVNSEVMVQPVLPAVWKPMPLWTGKQVITAVLNHLTKGCKPFTVEHEGKIPGTYFASKTGVNQSSEDKEENSEHKLLIWKNELVRGVIDKAQFGKYGLVHMVQELYGSNTAGILLSALSRLFTVFLQINGFTCGVDDLIISPHYDIQRKDKLEGEDVGEEVHYQFVNLTHDKTDETKLQLEIEKAIRRNGQSAITSLDMKMKSKLNEKGSEINKDLLLKGLLKPFPRNCISLMTISGAKGSSVNFQQISSFLGPQELEGKRVPRMVSGKTLPCFVPWDFASRAGGYITDRFLTGLRPQEYYFHCMAGREGLVDTAVKTSRSGYLQRCLIKNLECLKVCYDYTVRDADGSIIQFCYGEDGVDVHQTSFITRFEALAANQEIICEKFRHQLEFNTYINELPDGLKKKAAKFIDKLPKEDKISLKLERQEDFLKLMKQKYLLSLAQSGEPVGVIAAQSIGEPSTQMTLNTFHLAGRGEMNVTLGIPRLQEILMTASNDIKTPIMTCPFLELRSKEDAKCLVDKVKKVTVADVIETIEVRVLPLSINKHEFSRIYKLAIKLFKPKLVPLEDCVETLEVIFLRELEDAIQNHLFLLSKISGIKKFLPASKTKASNETDEDASGSRSQGEENGGDGDDQDDDDDEDGDERTEDLGLDAQKRKKQATDEMDYEDGSDEEDASNEVEKEIRDDDDEIGDEIEIRDDEIGAYDTDDESSKMSYKQDDLSKPKSMDREIKSKAKKKMVKAKLAKKDTDRAIFVEARGLHFQVHFRFTNEPHILLAQIAEKTAKKVQIKSSGKIDLCQLVKYDKNEQVIWKEGEEQNTPAMKMNDMKVPSVQQSQTDIKDPSATSLQTEKKDRDIQAQQTDDVVPAPWALKTAGVDFGSFWEMQDDLDVRRIYSNNIRAMLNTFGVEAARATIIREVKNVFGIYGVEIDYRHLSLIADFMTHSGGYQPMSRHGGIAESISPFLKMSFETASKFIVEAACHGMTDTLETPSARVCLGLPVKVGTGCFDLMQKLEM